jgi:hypothetical protein
MRFYPTAAGAVLTRANPRATAQNYGGPAKQSLGLGGPTFRLVISAGSLPPTSDAAPCSSWLPALMFCLFDASPCAPVGDLSIAASAGTSCGVFGGGRHRVYFEPSNVRLDDSVMNRVCLACGRGLPGKDRDDSRWTIGREPSDSEDRL